jgi:hypothetical protein
MLLSDLGKSLKLRRVTYGVFAFATIHDFLQWSLQSVAVGVTSIVVPRRVRPTWLIAASRDAVAITLSAD